MHERRVRANGIEFACLEEGDGPLVLLLHGFPDDARTWSHQMPALAAAGFRAVAPWMRGYPPTEIPAGGHYDTASLTADAITLLEALSPGAPAFLVGHDWGATAVYGTCASRPELVRRAVVLAVPHPSVMVRFLASYEQLRRSFYIWFFQLPFLPEQAVALDDFAFVDKLWRDWSPGHTDLDHVARVKETLGRPGALEAALAYYRALLDPSRGDPALADLRARITDPIRVPTLYLDGADDGCLGAELAVGAEDAFTGGYTARTIEGCGHFLHRERPDEVTRAILDWLGPPGR